MPLHTLNKAPGHNAFSDCIERLAADDALVLLGDGVYAALATTAAASRLAASGATIYVLRTDALAAGVATRLMSEATVIDDAGFVALTEHWPQQMAWH
ncbi:sulfurtransferase complex subunit TusB [Kineobactrum sediminis]|uniref:Sulfurtransferase complex subunit TusB n=1 Tax=Kineobactrum sediminis TaxID=1905677 RepID=A0A2N5Y196_9GAMM|nr:sulfurtransferase complex subunit TusB [Kineobactrum sediminis]PLW82163.1 sulfurtransferase complex subunit TusB [Kineobactrum sediminis]